MPKPMTMTIEVEEVAFGRVFRTLDGMPGVASIKVHGSGPRKIASPTKGGAATSQTLVLRALARGPLDKEALSTTMTNGGKKVTSLPSTLQELRKRKLITGGSGALYKLTKAGLSAATEEK